VNRESGNPALVEIIRAEIRKRGPVSFSWFMQQALYHPEHGYYSSGRAAIGRKGDYFTNISVGSLFGKLITAQFAEIWEQLGRTNNFVIVEQGAHDGQFARDVLSSAEENWPEFFDAMRYKIVEPFPFWRERQQAELGTFSPRVEWLEVLEPFAGIHFSNELVDAMPIDLSGKLVGLDGDNFVFVAADASATKCNRVALDWVNDVVGNLQRGYILIIDYGFAQEFREIVQTCADHRQLDSPFEQIGYADITAHIDWESIANRAKQNGARIAGFTDQHHFLTGIISTWPAFAESSDSKTKRALQTLLHPEMLGRTFQVMALEKGIDAGPQLAGFKFAKRHEP
jgi:SAM-dependent MidA family methyltransferase